MAVMPHHQHIHSFLCIHVRNVHKTCLHSKSIPHALHMSNPFHIMHVCTSRYALMMMTWWILQQNKVFLFWGGLPTLCLVSQNQNSFYGIKLSLNKRKVFQNIHRWLSSTWFGYPPQLSLYLSLHRCYILPKSRLEYKQVGGIKVWITKICPNFHTYFIMQVF